MKQVHVWPNPTSTTGVTLDWIQNRCDSGLDPELILASEQRLASCYSERSPLCLRGGIWASDGALGSSGRGTAAPGVVLVLLNSRLV